MSQGELLAGLWEASLSAGVIILAVLLLRVLFQSRTPQRVFCLLWDVVLMRLLIPGAMSSPVSVWQWLPKPFPARMQVLHPAVTPGLTVSVGGTVIGDAAALPGTAALHAPSPDVGAVLTAVWLTIALMQALWFFWSHLRSRWLYADSLPCKDTFVRDWLETHSLRRRVQIRTSDRIAAPLTYKVLRPVVLLPAEMDWMDKAALSFILEHEIQHIRRFDTLRKGLLTAVLCLHWFNPLVWVMYILCNRDMELACDETVAGQSADRAGYARTLLKMEERRGRLGLSGSHFSQNALEERIKLIMKHKRISITALITVLAAMSITVVSFASVASDKKPENDGWQVEWWTAEDYAVWLEEEKQMLQSIIGERGYTGSEGWFTWDQKRVDETIALYESILEDIKNGALYSKTITDKNGGTIEDAVLSSGTLNIAETFTFEEKDMVAPKAVDEAALTEELNAFGIGGSGNLMTYNGQLIRYLVDGVSVGDSGYAIRYVYSNPDGVVDVHTLRSVIRNADGSYDPMGELIGVVAKGETGFDQNLMDSATFSGGSAQVTMENRADIEKEIGEELEAYKAFGLSYQCEWNQDGEMQLRMSWNGKPVHSLYDTETGTWFANNLNGTELSDNAVDLETVYQAGRFCGLQECKCMSHDGAMLEGRNQIAYAEGDGGEGGKSFEEIFAQYQPYGLSYSPGESGVGSLNWNGQAVKSFADLKPDGGVFSYQNPYAESGLRVYTEYDADGRLSGLRAE